MNELVMILIVLSVVLSCIATVGVARDVALTKAQRVAQLVIVWLVPIVGAIVTTAVRRTQQSPRGRKAGEPWTAISDGQAITMALSQPGTEASHHDSGQP